MSRRIMTINRKLASNSYPLDKIISAWKLDGNANDSVGTNNGIPTNIDWVSGVGGYQAAKYDIGSDVISIPHNDNLSFAGASGDKPFSISFLVRKSTTDRSWFVSKRNPASSGGVEYQIADNSGVIIFNCYDGTSTIAANHTITLTPNVWYSFVGTYDGSGTSAGMTLYINTVDVSTRSSSGSYVKMNNLGYNVELGKIAFSTGYTLTGNLQNVSMWSVELSEEEVLNLHNDMMDGTFNTLI